MNLRELVNQTQEILEEGVMAIWVYKNGRSWNWKLMESDNMDDFELLNEHKQNEMIESFKQKTGDIHGLKLNGYNDLANYTKSGLYNEIYYRYEKYKEAELNSIDAELTTLEKTFIEEIPNDNFYDEDLDGGLWTNLFLDDLLIRRSINQNIARGIMGSLVKKKIITCENSVKNEECFSLTEKGKKILSDIVNSRYESKYFKRKGTKNTFKCLAKLKNENEEWYAYIVESSEGEPKLDFIKNLRSNGYKVNTRKVKRTAVYDFIIEKTNCEDYLWDIFYTEKDIEEYKKNELEFISNKFEKASETRKKNYYKRFGYKYTYKTRGFSPGCQPKDGFIKFENDINHEFGVIKYNRPLTSEEIENYELVNLNRV